MEAPEGPPLFYELPLEIHPLIFLQMDLETVGRACCVCKLWSSLGTDDLYGSLCLASGMEEKFKPPGKNWKWVILSKRPRVIDPDSEEKFDGVGSKVCKADLLLIV